MPTVATAEISDANCDTDMLRAKCRDLRAQRDALLAACEAARKVFCGREYPGAAGTTDAMKLIDAAIAAAKGEAT